MNKLKQLNRDCFIRYFIDLISFACGIKVVNIENGYRAAFAGYRILRSKF